MDSAGWTSLGVLQGVTKVSGKAAPGIPTKAGTSGWQNKKNLLQSCCHKTGDKDIVTNECFSGVTDQPKLKYMVKAYLCDVSFLCKMDLIQP